MSGIGIVGCGIAGLHLGLLLRQHDVDVTIYTDKTGDQIASGRLPNTVIHHFHTLEHEQELGVDHWKSADLGFHCTHVHFGGDQPLDFRGDPTYQPQAVDYRLYLPQLMADLEERGGAFIVQPGLQADDVERLSDRHDLMVVASGKGSLGAMFPRRSEKSPYDKPQRRICAGLFHGVAPADPKGITFSVSPGHGECVEFPFYTFEGTVTAFLMENHFGGDLELLADLSYDEDPKGFDRTFLDKLKDHHPTVHARVDPAEFGLTRPEDVLQGALPPAVRVDYVQLSTGRYAVALGDVHTVLDPIMGQGANAASYSAWTLGQLIVSDYDFDERFCEKLAREREDFVIGASDWTNFMLAPPPPHLQDLFVAMAEHKAIADEFTENFSYPDRQVDLLATPERTRRFLARRGVAGDG